MTDSHIDRVRQLSEWLNGTDIALLELSGPGTFVRLRRNGQASPSGVQEVQKVQKVQEVQPLPAMQTAGPVAAHTVVRAGSVGIALQSHPLRTDPLVQVGQQVVAGQTVALLKIGFVLLAVPAPRAGTVCRIVAPHEAPVGYGDPLVELL
jgi:acetyl-CoA carboxylase biotin carboxyl carrier protein